MFETIDVLKIQTYLCSTIFFSKVITIIRYCERISYSQIINDDNIIRRMRCACCILMSTDTQSKNVIFTAFPQREELSECASMLRYKQIACLILVFYLEKLLLAKIT